MNREIIEILNNYFWCTYSEFKNSESESGNQDCLDKVAISLGLNPIAPKWLNANMDGLKVICLNLLTRNNCLGRPEFNRGKALAFYSLLEKEFGKNANVYSNTNLYEPSCYQGASGFSYREEKLEDVVFGLGVAILSTEKGIFFYISENQ